MLLWLLYLIQYINNDDWINSIYQMFFYPRWLIVVVAYIFIWAAPAGIQPKNVVRVRTKIERVFREKRKRDRGGWIFFLSFPLLHLCHRVTSSIYFLLGHHPNRQVSHTLQWTFCFCLLEHMSCPCPRLYPCHRHPCAVSCFESGWASGVRSHSERRPGIRAGVCGTISTGWASYVCCLSRAVPYLCVFIALGFLFLSVELVDLGWSSPR